MPEHHKPDPAEGTPTNPANSLASTDDATWARILGLLAELDQFHAQIQRVLDILGSESRALVALWSSGGLTAGELARRVKLSNAATTTLIDRLEHRKLVTRSRSTTNKRFVNIQATPLAHERLATIGCHLQERFEHTASTEPHEAQLIDQALAPFRRLLDEAITTLRLTPVEVFPASLDGLPIRAFRTSED